MKRVPRHDLTDAQWAILASLIPAQPDGPGRKRNDPRRTLNGILWVLQTGCAWADLPARYGSGSTCWRWLQRWMSEGIWERIWRRLLGYLDQQHQIDWRYSYMDASFVAAKKGGRAVGKTMAGKGSKIMLLTDGAGFPLSVVVGTANHHEMRYTRRTLAGVSVPQPRGRPRTRPQVFIADKAFDDRALRRYLQQRGIKVRIPPVERRKRKTPKRGRPYKVGPEFRLRWHIERTNAWMDNSRRLVVRYERKPELFVAFCLVAFIRWCLKRILK
jgi:transposase